MSVEQQTGEQRSEAQQAPGITRRLTLAAVVLVFAAIPIGLFALYVFDQRGDLEERNLRALAKAATDITALLENANEVVRHARSKAEGQDNAFELDGPFLKSVECDVPAQAPDDPEGVDPESPLGMQLVFIKQGERYKLRLASCREGKGSHAVRLDKMLAELPIDDEMDLLLIARAGGEVVSSYSRFEHLGTSIRSIAALKAPNSEADAEFDVDATLVRPVVVAGKAYDLLCQPLETGAEIAGIVPAWAMCGLVDSNRAMTSALAVTPWLIILSFAVLVFGVLCWPMLKIIFLSDRERFRFVDLYFVLFGTWSALSIVTIAILGYQTKSELELLTEASNSQVAHQLAGRLEQELDSLYAQLQAYDALEPDDGVLHEIHNDDQTELLTKPYPQSRSADFETVFWIDPETGKQIRKATIRKQNTPTVNVSNREYFKAARDERLWTMGSGEWFVENVRSKTTMVVSTILSAKSSLCVSDDNTLAHCKSGGIRAIAAIQARLNSVTAPVLSPGVEFAVVDTDGKAVFTSDPRRVLKDNFFEELPGGDRLRAAVLARVTSDLELRYLGRPHSFHIKPMQTMPWTVLVFADHEPINSLTVETVGHALILTLVFVMINLLGTLAYLVWQGQDVPRWFWPTRGDRRYHANWSAGVLLFLLVLLAGLNLTDGLGQLILATLLPGLLVLMVLLTSRLKWVWWPAPMSLTYSKLRDLFTTDSSPAVTPVADQARVAVQEPPMIFWQKWLNERGWYVACSILLWLGIAVVPAYVFYANSLEASAAEFVRQENVFHTNRMVTRTDANEDYYRDIPHDCARASACPCRLTGGCSNDIYRSLLFEPRANREADPHYLSWVDQSGIRKHDEVLLSNKPVTPEWGYLARLKPIYSDTCRCVKNRNANTSSTTPTTTQRRDSGG